jgi:hypothetical protein
MLHHFVELNRRCLSAHALVLSICAVLAGAVVFPASAAAQTQSIIGTVAGRSDGSPGFSGDGGQATSAQLFEPYGMALDSAGNIYIADTRNQRIRKVTVATGVITTFAGNGTAGFGGDGGPATGAMLNLPTGVAVDGAGNVYISDQINNRIRKVTTNGIITTVAGNGQNAFYKGEGGPATAAQLCNPAMVAVDGSNNLYISDSGNMAIRKVSANGTITTVAGVGVSLCGQAGAFSGDGGPATAAKLNDPYGITLDAAGNLYIGDLLNNRIRKVTASTGKISTVAGDGTTSYNGDGIQATQASLNNPYMAALDSAGNLYIPDYYHYRIRKVTVSTGVITTVAGNGLSGLDGDGGPATQSYVSDPIGTAVDASGNFYIVDQASNRIRKVFPYTPPSTAPPSVTQNPSDVFTVPGGAATFMASANGTPAPGVQWQVSTDGGASFSNLSGQTGNILSFGAVQADSGKKYRAVFTNAYGTAATTAATLVVRPSAASRTDLDGDHIGDLTVWRPGNGTWFTLTSSSGFAYSSQMMHQWGNQSQGDVPMMGDIDGDSIADVAVWRASTGTWYWLTSSTGYASSSAGIKQWGNQSAGDVPMLGDIDGDGKMDLVLWRASTGTWFWLTSSSGYDYNSSGAKQWGSQASGDVPKLADIDGDGKADLIVWRAPTGTWFWLTSSSGYNTAAAGSKQWGNQSAGDVPMVGDIDGDGKTELIVWRAPTGTWYWLTSTTGYSASAGLQWGNQASGDIPLLIDLDGDGKADLTVWRASTGTWYWLKSSNGYNTAAPGSKQWGSQAQGDIPIFK